MSLGRCQVYQFRLKMKDQKEIECRTRMVCVNETSTLCEDAGALDLRQVPVKTLVERRASHTGKVYGRNDRRNKVHLVGNAVGPRKPHFCNQPASWSSWDIAGPIMSLDFLVYGLCMAKSSVVSPTPCHCSGRGWRYMRFDFTPVL